MLWPIETWTRKSLQFQPPETQPAGDLAPGVRGEDAADEEDGERRKHERRPFATSGLEGLSRIERGRGGEATDRHDGEQDAGAGEDRGGCERDRPVEAARGQADEIGEMGGHVRRKDDPDAQPARRPEPGHEPRHQEPAGDGEQERPGDDDRDEGREPGQGRRRRPGR